MPIKLWKSFLVLFVFCIFLSYFQSNIKFVPFFNFKFFEQFLIYNVNITDYIKSGIIHVLLSLAGLSFAVGTFNIIINNNNIDNFINFYYFTKYSKYIIIYIIIEILIIVYEFYLILISNSSKHQYIGSNNVKTDNLNLIYAFEFLPIVVFLAFGLFLFVLKTSIFDDRYNKNIYFLSINLIKVFINNFDKIIFVSTKSFMIELQQLSKFIIILPFIIPLIISFQFVSLNSNYGKNIYWILQFNFFNVISAVVYKKIFMEKIQIFFKEQNLINNDNLSTRFDESHYEYKIKAFFVIFLLASVIFFYFKGMHM